MKAFFFLLKSFFVLLGIALAIGAPDDALIQPAIGVAMAFAVSYWMAVSE